MIEEFLYADIYFEEGTITVVQKSSDSNPSYRKVTIYKEGDLYVIECSPENWHVTLNGFFPSKEYVDNIEPRFISYERPFFFCKKKPYVDAGFYKLKQKEYEIKVYKTSSIIIKKRK